MQCWMHSSPPPTCACAASIEYRGGSRHSPYRAGTILTLFCFFHGLLMRKTFPIRLTDLWRLTIRSWFLIILFYKHSFLRLLFNISSYNYELPAQNVKLNCFQLKIWNLNALLFFTLVKVHGRITSTLIRKRMFETCILPAIN